MDKRRNKLKIKVELSIKLRRGSVYCRHIKSLTCAKERLKEILFYFFSLKLTNVRRLKIRKIAIKLVHELKKIMEMKKSISEMKKQFWGFLYQNGTFLQYWPLLNFKSKHIMD